MEEELEYHRSRARAELDLGYRAAHRAAADAHMRLAALHLRRLKRGDERCDGAGPGGNA